MEWAPAISVRTGDFISLVGPDSEIDPITTGLVTHIHLDFDDQGVYLHIHMGAKFYGLRVDPQDWVLVACLN